MTVHNVRMIAESDDVFSGTEELIDAARNGRMLLLVDDEDREKEGVLFVPAQMATPDAVNFMARHGRGLICLALEQERADQLGLAMMTQRNASRRQDAFTVSIEARTGVTTGISAADRARTIAVAIDSNVGAEAIVSPGHVFPLVSRPGGVLVRAGCTEAAVDLSRLAGLNSSGVICKIMAEDGTMARLNDLVTFARTHNMKIGTIRDLIAYRCRHDRQIERRSETRFVSRWGGEWRSMTFCNKVAGTETTALVKGAIASDRPTLVRMHRFSAYADSFGDVAARRDLLSRSMEIIGEAGSGVLIIVNGPMPDLPTPPLKLHLVGSNDAEPELAELRDYGVGVQVLIELGVRDVLLLSNSHQSPIALSGYGLSIVGQRDIDVPPLPQAVSQ
jgi:3,4-dihydroxy 2-butanone 4-phosphate synthase/GTP cyclohydrolase II